jgi:hypothetical protein
VINLGATIHTPYGSKLFILNVRLLNTSSDLSLNLSISDGNGCGLYHFKRLNQTFPILKLYLFTPYNLHIPGGVVQATALFRSEGTINELYKRFRVTLGFSKGASFFHTEKKPPIREGRW